MTHHTNEKAAGASNTNGLHTDTNKSDFRIQDPHSKELANLLARLALAGHIVIKGSGDYTVCKYGLTRYCCNFAELKAFAIKLGVIHD